jgi:hypothetical protein
MIDQVVQEVFKNFRGFVLIEIRTAQTFFDFLGIIFEDLSTEVERGNGPARSFIELFCQAFFLVAVTLFPTAGVSGHGSPPQNWI